MEADYELITQEECDNLPEDDGACFLEFESICRRKLNRLLSQLDRDDDPDPLRDTYMSKVASAAAECRIPDVSIPSVGNNYERFRLFQIDVDAAVTKLRLRSRRGRDAYSVQLRPATRAKIEAQISILRQIIQESDLTESRKRTLQNKLDELSQEIAGSRRLSFAKAMAVLVPVMSFAAGVTSATADAPSAVANIMKLINWDKATEERAAQRLALPSPPKALPAPEAAPLDDPAPASVPLSSAWDQPSYGGRGWSKPNSNLDDDIPF